jgi:hypothetical protein
LGDTGVLAGQVVEIKPDDKPGAYKASIEYPGFKPLGVTLELKEVGGGHQSPPRSEPTYRLEEGE